MPGLKNPFRKMTGRTDITPSLHYLNAEIYTAEKNAPSAEAELRRAIEIDENYFPAYSAYATLLVAQNQAANGDRAISKDRREKAFGGHLYAARHA